MNKKPLQCNSPNWQQKFIHIYIAHAVKHDIESDANDFKGN